ncbi:hypothetical protein IOD16_37885 [Saccharothrix sp. 6-C]|uniref:hypothetical protein n=1 Tax=Saccharothrix sp. 6-C TaxID=2781735 RepID=UPI0019175A54|nr:hypothetical protein [Saccharothrix sp. 6-C]QQQ76680.1 hypothetical protein IOD16_37885 [Saccharothrix sp. 6-C]
MCDVEVHQDSTVRYGHDGDACERARSGESPLFAVWPGQWSSDMFVIDDLATFARQMGEQQGWDVATSRGWGSRWSAAEGKTYSVRVRRTTLRRR